MEKKDYDVLKEIALLKNEEKQKENGLEIEKEAFKKKLMGGMGEDMLETLKHPKKPSFWVGLKYKYARWKKIRQENRQVRKILRKNKKNGEQ